MAWLLRCLLLPVLMPAATGALSAESDCASPLGSGRLHRCATAPPAQRAADLLAQLSSAEIVQQTWMPDGGSAAAILEWTHGLGVGSASLGAARSPTGNITEEVELRNDFQRKIMEASPHKIPAAFFAEALHSATAGGTVFPELVTQGSTWDPALIEEIGAAIATEASACGINIAFSPVLNMWVDSRFGRLQEGYSENPTLTTACKPTDCLLTACCDCCCVFLARQSVCVPLSGIRRSACWHRCHRPDTRSAGRAAEGELGLLQQQQGHRSRKTLRSLRRSPRRAERRPR